MTKKILYSFMALVMSLWVIWADITLVGLAIACINAPSSMSVFFGFNMCLFTVLLTIWAALIVKDFIKQNILN
jgi:hypothetical protein